MMRMPNTNPTLVFDGRQRGVALFISLVLLLVLTIAGVSAVQTTSLEERMARNTHDSLLAFQSAESALREAEGWIIGNISSTAQFSDNGINGLWTSAPYDEADQRWEEDIWADGNAQSIVVTSTVNGVVAQPRFIVEWVATVQRDENPNLLGSSYSSVFDRIEIFRITSRGVGATANARVMLQGTFGMIF
jgi:type IV pilus assembly protein PilX